MSILPVVYQIIMLFIIVAVGLLLRVKKVFTDPVIKGVNTTVIYVTWPAMLLMTTQKSHTPETFSDFMLILLMSTLIMGGSLLILYALMRRAKDQRLRPVMAMIAAMPNAGYIGLPIIQAVYGDTGALYLAAYICGFNVVLWTAGVALFTGFSKSTLRAMLNPGLLASFIGVLLFALKIALPTPILSAVHQLGALNTPLAMLLLGARLDTVRFYHLKGLNLWLCIALKLILIPLIAYGALRLLHIEGMALGVLMLATMMPSASAGQMLAEKYDMHVDFAARGVSISTLLCIVTIPVLMLLMGI